MVKGDIKYHEPLPKILLLDFESEITEKLQKSPHNFKIGKIRKTGDSWCNMVGQKYNEIDIAFLHARFSFRDEVPHSSMPQSFQKIFEQPVSKTKFSPTLMAGGFPISCDEFSQFLNYKRKGGFVVFVDRNAEDSIKRFFPFVKIHDFKFVINRTLYFVNDE